MIYIAVEKFNTLSLLEYPYFYNERNEIDIAIRNTLKGFRTNCVGIKYVLSITCFFSIKSANLLIQQHCWVNFKLLLGTTGNKLFGKMLFST